MQKCDICGKEMVSGLPMHKRTHEKKGGEAKPKDAGVFGISPDEVTTSTVIKVVPTSLVSSDKMNKILDQLHSQLGDGAYRAKLKAIRATVNISIDELKQELKRFTDEVSEGELKQAINEAVNQL